LSIRTSRRSKRVIAAAVAVAVSASTFAITNSPVSATAAVGSVRVAGADRYATSVEISKTITNNSTFVLASGDDFADALVASALAGDLGASIILLPADGTISAGAKTRMAAATSVYIVGGPAALPATLEAAVQAATPNTVTFTRLGGSTRQETSALVADEIGFAAGNTAILATGSNFADAVSAGSLAYAGPHPIFLNMGSSLNAAVKAQISALGITTVLILGGTAAVPASVAAEVDAMTGVSVVRIGGATRYETAAALATFQTTSLAAGGLGWGKENVGIANIGNPAGGRSGGADALAAAPYLGGVPAALLGVSASGVPAATSAWLSANKASVETLHVFGGTAAVSAATLESALVAAGKLGAVTASIEASEKSKFVTITFSAPVENGIATTLSNYQLLAPNGAVIPLVTDDEIVFGATNTSKVTLVLTDSVAAQLVAGSTVQVLASNSFISADGRAITATSTVVAADSVAPVATLTAVLGSLAAGGTRNQFTVTFSEPVKFATAAQEDERDFTINGAAPTWTTLTVDADTIAGSDWFTSMTVTTSADLGKFEVLGLKANIVEDAKGLKNAAASVVVTEDLVRPTVVGAPTYKVTTSAGVAATVATAVLDGKINITAATAGTVGNGVKLTVRTATGGNPDGTIVVSGKEITFYGTAVTVTNIVSGLNSNAGASALASFSVVAGQGGQTISNNTNVTTSGGTDATTATKLSITVTFSEPLSDASGTVNYRKDAISPANIALSAPNFTHGDSVVVFEATITPATESPVPGGAAIAFNAGAVEDLAGNGNAAVTTLIVAG
jgi:putative cell wall-binding protein